MRPNGVCRTDFEAWILTLMAEAGIDTYADLASQAGVDTSTIQRVCSGATEASITTLKKLASALDCSLNELVNHHNAVERISMAGIEVYVWEAGKPRPGSEGRISDHCIDLLSVPGDAQLPITGDIIWCGKGEIWHDLFPYRVVDREFLWHRIGVTDHQQPSKFGKMMLYVQKLSETEYNRAIS